ncbi:MAG: DHH family phosphoesterase [Candidatus Eisenbacteria sp.]|nr:DHH family phosphoesterase [Candidatus Eisenbacteria bacterium]
MEQLKRVVDFIRDREEFMVVCHYDADGLAAGAIVSSLLDRLGKKNTVVPTKQMDSERIALIKGGKNHIFTDFGSGQIPVLEEHLTDYAIIDHHATLGETDKPHFNAHLVGFDGATEISGAGMSYLVAREFGFKDLSAMAIVGAVGDMQDSGGRLVGHNRIILAEAVEAGAITAKTDIRLFGRHSRLLTQFITFASDPIFPGLTGDEGAAKAFLSQLGIPLRDGDDWLRYVDLGEDQKKKLISALYVYGKQQRVPERYLKSLVGEVYELTQEKDKSFVKDAKDFATLLNACGRHEEGAIGLEVAKGDRGDYYKRAEALLLQHRRMLREGIEWAKQHGTEDHKSFYLLDAGDKIKDTLIGVIAGMLYGAQVIGQDKPIIGLSFDEAEGKMKASGRATWPLVRSGVHLGKAMKAAASAVGGEGGGHNIAAGAHFPPGRRDDFLKALEKELARKPF